MTLRCLVILLLLSACVLMTGCDPDLARTKEQTDEMVYQIVDKAWQDDFGGKANYKIQDVPSDGNDLGICTDIPASGILTLPEAVGIATRYNRQYTTEKENLYLTALDFTEIRHVYEPMPILGGQAEYEQDDDNKSYGLFSNYGFSQLLATGAQIGADISLGWLDVVSGDVRSGLSTVVSAVVSQPLLRGSGRKIALENLTQGQRNTLYQVRSFNRYRKEFVAAVATEYLRVLELYDRQQNIGQHYTELSKISYSLKKRAKAGKIEIHELEEAEQDRTIAMAAYVAAKKDYEQAFDAFKMMLSIKPDMEFMLDIDELLICRVMDIPEFTLTEAQAIDIALNQRLDLANESDSVEDVQRKVELAADAIRAELNLVGSAEIDRLNNSAFGAGSGQLERTRERYQLSVELDLPIDRLAEKNDYRRSLIALMQQQRQHLELTDFVILQVRKAYRDMKEARQRYDIETDNLRLAESRTEHTLSLNRYGRASIRDVLDAQEDLVDAKNALTTALVDYFEASLAFLRDTGTLKVRPDGMWEKSDIYQVNTMK